MTTTTEQRSILWGLTQNAPVLGFLMALQITDSFRLAGWVGAGLALGVLIAAVLRRAKVDPIVAGINVYFVLLTPMIELTYAIQADTAGAFLAANAPRGVMLSVFLVGLAMTLAKGAVFADGATPDVRRRRSLTLLGVAGLGALWSCVASGGSFAVVGIPMIVLFSTRRFLQAADQKADEVQA